MKEVPSKQKSRKILSTSLASLSYYLKPLAIRHLPSTNNFSIANKMFCFPVILNNRGYKISPFYLLLGEIPALPKITYLAYLRLFLKSIGYDVTSF